MLYADDESYHRIIIGSLYHTLHPLFLFIGSSIGIHHDKQHRTSLIGIVECSIALDPLILHVTIRGVMPFVETELWILEQFVVSHAGHNGQARHDLPRFIKMCKFVLAHGTWIYLISYVHQQSHIVFKSLLSPLLMGFSLCHAQQPFIVRTLVALVIANHQDAEGKTTICLWHGAEMANLTCLIAWTYLIIIYGVWRETCQLGCMPIVVSGNLLPLEFWMLKIKIIGWSAVAHHRTVIDVLCLPTHLYAVGGSLIQIWGSHFSWCLIRLHRKSDGSVCAVAIVDIVDVRLA